MSAVLSGVKEVREVLRAAEDRRRREGRRTVVFIDEIHRFNKAQQDALLAHVESGDIVLIGATTENPSFEVNAALLSRSRVVVLKPLAAEQLLVVLRQALADARARPRPRTRRRSTRRRSRSSPRRPTATRARRSTCWSSRSTAAAPGEDGRRHVDLPAMREAFARKALLYDRAGEEHYNVISALHKSIRNSDADAGLYWLARMLEAGEDPLYVARRLVRFASEDVGLADPQALVVAMAAQQAVHFIGLPEGALALAELVVYLAAAPKSNAVYAAYGEAVARRARDARRAGAAVDPQRAHGPHEGPRLRQGLPLRARRGGGRRRDGLPARRARRPALLPADRPRARGRSAAARARGRAPRQGAEEGAAGPRLKRLERRGAAEQVPLAVVDPELDAGLPLALASRCPRR